MGVALISLFDDSSTGLTLPMSLGLPSWAGPLFGMIG